MKISLQTKRVVIFFAIIVVTIFFGLLYHWSLQVKPNNVDLSDFIPEEQEYQLLAYDNLVRPASFELPTVRTKPSASLKYQLVQLIELTDIKTKKYSNLFFADKRIAELMEWGKDFDYQTWEDILNKYYNSISSSLSHLPTTQFLDPLTEIYSHVLTNRNLINQKINEIGDIKQKQLLVIITDDIFQSIEKRVSKLFPQSSSDLTTYSLVDVLKNKNFGYFDVFIDSTDLPNYFLTNTYLSINNQQFPPAEFDQENNRLVFHNIPLTGNEKTISLYFKPILLTPSKIWEEKIPLTDEEPYQYFLPVINLPYAIDYRYQFESKINQSAQLQLEQQYATVEAMLNPKSKEVLYYYSTEKIDQLINYSLYPHYVPFTVYDQINVENLRPNILQTWAQLTSKEKLSNEEIKSLRFSIYPFMFPSVTIAKTGESLDKLPAYNIRPLKNHQFELTLNNTTFAQEQYILQSLGFGWKPASSQNPNAIIITYWPSKVLKIILLLLFGLLFFYTNWFYLKEKRPHQNNWVDRLFSASTYNMIVGLLTLPFRLFWRLIKNIGTNFRLFWFVISLLGIFVDIFYLKKNSDFITVLFTVSWSLAMIGYRLEARTSFLFALFYLVLCPFLLIAKYDFIAEKAAIWTYMMLIVGTVQSIIELKANPTNLINPFSIILFLLNKISNFLEKIRKIFLLVRTIILKFIKSVLKRITRIIIIIFYRIINVKPKNIYDLIFNFIKIILFAIILLLILGAFIAVFLFMINSINKFTKNVYKAYVTKIAAEKRDRLWKSIIPAVDRVEPSLVYRGTKVVIYGRNFGWKNEPEVKLYKNDREVIPDEITSDKVIFSIPLDWPDGDQTFQIEKIVGWEGKDVKVETDSFSIKVIPVTGGYTKDDDEFFRLLPSLSPETRKRNGYE